MLEVHHRHKSMLLDDVCPWQNLLVLLPPRLHYSGYLVAEDRINHFYVCIDNFVYFTKWTTWVCFILRIFLYISPVHRLLYHCIVVISKFLLICLCILHIFMQLIFAYFTQSTPWLYTILGSLSYIFPVYNLLWHCVTILIDLHSWWLINTPLSEFTIYLAHTLKHTSSWLIPQYLIYLIPL